MKFTKLLITKAKKNKKTIVFPEAGFSKRIVEAGVIIAKKSIANVVFIGDKDELRKQINPKYLNKITIYNPNSCTFFDDLVNIVMQKRKHKGITLKEAHSLLLDPVYFAVTFVEAGYADGMVAGAEISTAKTLKPALQIIKSKQGLVSSYFLFEGKNRVTDDVFLMGDCAVVEKPDANQLCQIANLMIEQNNLLSAVSPKVAFLSYSTLGSANSESTNKVRSAFEMFKNQNPNINAIGEVQFDASVLKSVAKTKMPNHNFTGASNIFIMPNIDAGNICYKMVQYFGGLKAIGPITMGFNKPVNDLSRGCTIQDIVLLTAITAIQAN